MIRPFAPVVLASAAAAVLALAPAAAAQAIGEYQAKAAFIHNVLAFVEWPPAALASAAPIEIAVLGRPAGDEIVAALAGRSSKRHPLNVRVYERGSEIPDCHVLVVTLDAADEMRSALRAVAGRAVLTIAEGTGVSSSAAAITLFVAETRLAFAVDLDAADASGVRPDANLLRLARHVRGRKLGGRP